MDFSEMLGILFSFNSALPELESKLPPEEGNAILICLSRLKSV